MIGEIKRRFIDKIKSWELSRYYSLKSSKASNKQQLFIYMADGRIHHGGLSDRICGMVSVYNYCKKNDILFKIHFNYPYLLTDFLEPVCHDWTISEDEISYHRKESIPLYISTYSKDQEKSFHYFEEKLKNRKNRQIHLYTNARYFRWDEFQPLFSELFKPKPILQKMIDEYKDKLPSHYISLTFRFQQLLGDFKEDGFPVIISSIERNALIDNCLSCIKKLHAEKQMPILVTSDSVSFLDKASQLDFVYVIPGEMRHLDYNRNTDVGHDVDMKSFVDLYLLANSDCLYLYVNTPLYNSSFPRTAARIYNKPFVQLNEIP